MAPDNGRTARNGPVFANPTLNTVMGLWCSMGKRVQQQNTNLFCVCRLVPEVDASAIVQF